MKNLKGKLFFSSGHGAKLDLIIKVLEDDGRFRKIEIYGLDLKNKEVNLEDSYSLLVSTWDSKLNYPVDIDEDTAQGLIIGIFEKIG